MSGEGVMYTNKHIQPSGPADKPIAYLFEGKTGTTQAKDEYFWSRDMIGLQKGTGLFDPTSGLEVTTTDAFHDKADGSGEQIPWCHRSPVAPSYVEVPGYTTINLACSGATQPSVVTDKGLPKPGVDFTDVVANGKTVPSQLNQMIAAQKATGGDIEVINLSIGGNDFGFADIAAGVILAYLANPPWTFMPFNGPTVEEVTSPKQVQLVTTRVQTAIENIATAMEQIGDDDYRIVFQGIPMPLPEPDQYTPQESVQYPMSTLGIGEKALAGGCPVFGRADGITAFFDPIGMPDISEADYPGDAEWIADTVFPALTGAMKAGVQQARESLGPNGPKIVFNDVADAMKGHELCAPGINREQREGVTYDIRNGEKPVFGPGQGADTEWMNAVGRDVGNLAANENVKDDEGNIIDGWVASGETLSTVIDNANFLTQVLHPNYWGQRALASCAEAAMSTPSDYIACQPHPAGGTDAKGRPLMLASAPADFTPMAPMRAVDTRAATESRAAGPLAAGAPVEIDLTGMIPAGATAVSYNLTVTDQTASGYAEVAPAGAAAGSSTINWTGPLQTIANGHISKVNGGKVQVTLGGSGTAHVILDITGAFTAAGTSPDAGGFTAVERRVHDSRDGDGPLAPGASRTLNINDDVRAMAAGSAPVAAAVNVTVTGTTGSGVLSVAKETTATTSTINWSGTNQTIANAVITDVAEDGSFTVTNNGKTPAEIVVDLTGTFTPGTGAKFYATDPARSYDSRTSDRPLTDTRSRVNTHPVPAEAVAVAVNTTITGTTGSGWLAVTNSATTTPMTSTVNWYESPTTRANGSISGATDATTRAHVGGLGSTNYLLDVAGYFQ